MDTEATEPVIQKIILQVVESLKGDNIVKHLDRLIAQTRKAEASIKRYQSAIRGSGSAARTAAKATDAYRSAQQKVAQSIKQAQKPMREQLDLIRKYRSESAQASRASQGLGRASLGLGRSLKQTLGLLAGGSLIYSAVSRIKETVQKEFALALAGGPGQVAALRGLTGGRNMLAASDLAGRFQQQNAYARFALGEQALPGLVAAQRALEKIGLDRANEIILAVTESLEPDKLRQFVETAAGGNVRGALMGAATDKNIMAVTTALNALKTSQGLAGAPQTMDPVLRAAANLESAAQRIGDAFDTLVVKLADQLAPQIDNLASAIEKAAGWAGKIGTDQGASWLEVGAGAVGAYLGVKGIGWAGKQGLQWAGGKLLGGAGAAGAGRAATQVIPRIVGFAAPGGVAAAPALAGLGGAALAGLGVAAATVGVGLSAGMGAGYLMERGGLLEAQERAAAQQARFAEIAQRNKAAQDQATRLKGERQTLDLEIGRYSEEHKRGFVRRFFGADDLSETDRKVVAEMGKRREALTRQIEALNAAQKETAKQAEQTPTQTTPAKLAQDAQKAQVEVDALNDNLKRLQDNAAKRVTLDLSAQEAASVSQLARLQAQIAETTPLGTIGAINQLRALQQTLQVEITRLTEILESIDQSTTEGVIEANKIRAQILGLKLEQRQTSEQIRQSYKGMDQIIGAGRWEKVLFDFNHNVAKALELGISNPALYPEPWNKTGMPVPASQIYGPVYREYHDRVERVRNQGRKVDQLKEINKGLAQLIRLEENDLPSPFPQATKYQTEKRPGSL